MNRQERRERKIRMRRRKRKRKRVKRKGGERQKWEGEEGEKEEVWLSFQAQGPFNHPLLTFKIMYKNMPTDPILSLAMSSLLRVWGCLSTMGMDNSSRYILGRQIIHGTARMVSLESTSTLPSNMDLFLLVFLGHSKMGIQTQLSPKCF